MKIVRQLFITAGLMLTVPLASFAQLISGETFLQGTYVEVGVASNGAYGSGNDAPSGYHPRGVGSLVGFVADIGKDGWTVGTPTYVGDYFLPGSPQEGWDMELNGVWAQAWRGGGPTSMTGGLTGGNTDYTSTATTVSGTWEGTLGALKIRQVTKIKKDKLYFTTVVQLKNTGTTTLYNFYYSRSVDPDNEEALVGAAEFTTINKIIYTLPSVNNKTLVRALGQTYHSYLGLGSRDCRAKPYIISGSLSPIDSLHTMYSGNGATSTIFDTVTHVADEGIGLVFKIDSLRAGDSTILSYAYILSEADLDSAFDDLKPVLTISGKPYLDRDTLKACVGAKLTVDILNADYYDWTWTPNTNLSTDKGSRTTITVGPTPITYTATPSSTLCALDPLYITVEPLPIPASPTVTTPIYYCQYDGAPPLTAIPASGGTLVWYTTATGGTPLTSITPPTNVVGSTTYYVSQIINTCESNRVPLTVTIRALPVISNFTFTSPTHCAATDGSISFNADQPVKTYTVFYDKNGAPQTPVTVTSDVAGGIVLSGLGGGNYTNFYITNEFGCKSNINPGPLTLVDPVPPGPPISNNGPVCVDDSVLLFAPLLDSVTYKWSGPDGFSSTDQSPRFTASDNSAGVYTLIVTKGICVYNPSTTSLVVAATPKKQNIPPVTLCEETKLDIGYKSEPATDYTWTGNGITVYNAHLVIPSINTSQAGQYFLQSTSTTGCTTYDTVTVHVDENISIAYNPDTSICNNAAASLYVNTDAPSVSWMPTDGLSDPNSRTPLASPAATTVYTVTAHTQSTCLDKSGSMTVTVVPAPAVQGYDTVIRMNVPYTLTPTYGPDVVQWRWEPADSLSCSNCANPVFNSNKNTSYVLYVSNSLGCTSADTVNITVFCDGASVTMPNAFTPNGDNHNDIYYVRGHGFVVRKFAIYNRLGQEVFSKENFNPNDPQYGWDGTFQGTKITNADGFVYLLEVQCYNSNNSPMTMKGSFLLIK